MAQKRGGRGFGVFPNGLDFMVMAGWVFVTQILTMVITALSGWEFPDEELINSSDDLVSLWTQLSAAQSLAIVYSGSMVLSLVGVLLYRRMRGGKGPVLAHSKAGFDPSRLLGLFVVMVALQVVIEPLTMMMPEVSPMIGRGFFTILVSIVLAPIFEELLCRGIVLESFRAKYGVFVGWIVSSLFFGVIHGQITAMLNASILGLVLGYAYIRSNSIFSVIILHALNNGLALVLMAFGFEESSFRDICPSETLYYALWAAAFLIVVIGSIVMGRNLILERRREKITIQE